MQDGDLVTFKQSPFNESVIDAEIFIYKLGLKNLIAARTKCGKIIPVSNQENGNLFWTFEVLGGKRYEATYLAKSNEE